MDSGFLAVSLAFILIGTAGIVLFYGPLTPSGDSCYCIIPSPEPGAAQGTSSIILAMGVLFFPMGLLKGGPPSFRRSPVLPQVGPGVGGHVPAIPMVSGFMFGLGILLTVIGVDALVVPGYLVLKSFPITGTGIDLTALGMALAFLGSRRPRPA